MSLGFSFLSPNWQDITYKKETGFRLSLWCARRDLKPGYVNRFGKYVVGSKGYSTPLRRRFADVQHRTCGCKYCYFCRLRQTQRQRILVSTDANCFLQAIQAVLKCGDFRVLAGLYHQYCNFFCAHIITSKKS